MAQTDDFSGMWRVTHWYPTKNDDAEENSVHEMQAGQEGNRVTLESLPGKDESYMFVALNVNGDVATGKWHEETKIDGDFKGAMYSGAGQLIISEDRRTMEGLWAGAGFDRAANKLKMYTGRWKIERI